MNSFKGYLQTIKSDSSKGFQFFSICRQTVSFFTGIILAKSAFSTIDIGTFELWMLIGMILSFAGLSGVLQAFLAQYGKIDSLRKGQFIFTTFLLIWLITGLLALVLFFTRNYFFESLLKVEPLDNFSLVLVFLLVHFNAIFAPYISLVKGNAQFFLPYSIFFLMGNLGAVAFPVIIGSSLTILLYSLIIWSVLEQLVLGFLLLRFATFHISTIFIRTLLVAGFPLALYSGAGLIAQIFDAWLVNHYFSDLSVFAIFRYGAREMPGAVALASAFTAGMIVKLNSSSRDGINRIKLGSERFMHFFFPISLALLFLSERLFQFIYNENFKESSVIFNTYLLLMVSRWIFPQAILIGLGKNIMLFLISLIELVINIIASLFLVKYFGLVGVAMGTVIAFWFEKFIMVILLSFKYGIRFSDYVSVKPFAMYSILLIFGFIWVYFS